MTLRLSPIEDERLAQLARSFRMSKNMAAAAAINEVAPKPDHPDFVQSATSRLIERYSGLFERLADA